MHYKAGANNKIKIKKIFMYNMYTKKIVKTKKSDFLFLILNIKNHTIQTKENKKQTNILYFFFKL
ncbi:hypothetical protein, partial [Helicobacter pylori]|uniref:hypothetical protein n=1 Tax=Helicobacter pylori TaxID=210 RepID=UPI0036F20EEE